VKGQLVTKVFEKRSNKSISARAKEMADQHYDLLFGLINHRISSGMTQQQVADALGITQQAIAKFESMESDPRMSTVRQYALAVGVSIQTQIIH
jgi:DNA-binding XRE family transcriptional regulator